MPDQDTLPIPVEPDPNPGRIYINEQVYIDQADDICVVWVHGTAWHRFLASSAIDWRIVGANLVIAGLASTVAVVRGLGLNRDTLYRDRKRLMEGGLPELASVRRGPQGPSKATPKLSAHARKLYRQGHSLSEIGRRLGVSRSTVRTMVKDLRDAGRAGNQSILDALEPGESEEPSGESEEPSGGLHPQSADDEDEGGATKTDDTVDAEPVGAGNTSSDAKQGGSSEGDNEEAGARAEDGAHGCPGEVDSAFCPVFPHRETTSERDLDRTIERVLASRGEITEAEVRYVGGTDLSFIGALLILPALTSTGFFSGIESVYGKLKNGFYGLRHTAMSLAVMLTLRITRAEQLTGVSPTALGRLLGLDRVPEVKTLRRRVREIASMGKAAELMRWYAQRLAAADPEVTGFFYVDGHTRIYYGKRKLSKSYSTRKRLALPAVTDFWVHDADGEPIFVVTGEVNQALTKQLLPLVDELKKLAPSDARITFIFDRGGWSPRLFKKLVDAGCDFITYRKGKSSLRSYPAGDFTEQTFKVGDEEFSYPLRDGVARFRVGMQFRQVTRREQDGRQIRYITSRKDLAAAEVVYRLSDRWRQENFFKYAREQFDLDGLDTYEVEDDDPDRTVPNPQRKGFDKQIAALRAELTRLESELGRAANESEESRRRTTRGFQIAHGKLRRKIAEIKSQIDELVEQRKQLPTRVPVGETQDGPPLRLEVEHKHFMNIVKMAVYRAECLLFRLVMPHYKRTADEGRALLREALSSSGSLQVADGQLRVTLDPLSAPRRTIAVARICEELNEADVRVPGTTLRLRFAVSRETGVSEMAMGRCQEV